MTLSTTSTAHGHDGASSGCVSSTTREAEHRAEHVGADVAEHEPLAEIVGSDRDERADDRCDRDSERVAPAMIAIGIHRRRRP